MVRMLKQMPTIKYFFFFSWGYYYFSAGTSAFSKSLSTVTTAAGLKADTA
jgi:hypothetical protein